MFDSYLFNNTAPTNSLAFFQNSGTLTHIIQNCVFDTNPNLEDTTDSANFDNEAVILVIDRC